VLFEAACAHPPDFEVVGRLLAYNEILDRKIAETEGLLAMLTGMHRSINDALGRQMALIEQED